MKDKGYILFTKEELAELFQENKPEGYLIEALSDKEINAYIEDLYKKEYPKFGKSYQSWANWETWEAYTLLMNEEPLTRRMNTFDKNYRKKIQKGVFNLNLAAQGLKNNVGPELKKVAKKLDDEDLLKGWSKIKWEQIAIVMMKY